MSDGKDVDETLISELLKQKSLETHLSIATIMDQTIKKGFPKNWLIMNWIKPIYKGEERTRHKDEQGTCLIITVTLDCNRMKTMRWFLVMMMMRPHKSLLVHQMGPKMMAHL